MGVRGKLRVNRHEQGKKLGKAFLTLLESVLRDVHPRPVLDGEERAQLTEGFFEGFKGWEKLPLKIEERREAGNFLLELQRDLDKEYLRSLRKKRPSKAKK